MGMFDWYEPEPSLRCPACRTLLEGWQGKDGPCGLFVWRQGTSAPKLQSVDEPWHQDRLAEFRLPEGSLGIYTTCQGCKHWVDALAFVQIGMWTHTEVETPENAVQRSHESNREFSVRKTRLAEWIAEEPPGYRTTGAD